MANQAIMTHSYGLIWPHSYSPALLPQASLTKLTVAVLLVNVNTYSYCKTYILHITYVLHVAVMSKKSGPGGIKSTRSDETLLRSAAVHNIAT